MAASTGGRPRCGLPDRDSLGYRAQKLVLLELVVSPPEAGAGEVVRASETALYLEHLWRVMVSSAGFREQDRVPAVAQPLRATNATRDGVARLVATGKPPSAIAAELGIAKATAGRGRRARAFAAWRRAQAARTRRLRT
jgi:hypothetical protein